MLIVKINTSLADLQSLGLTLERKSNGNYGDVLEWIEFGLVFVEDPKDDSKVIIQLFQYSQIERGDDWGKYGLKHIKNQKVDKSEIINVEI